VAQLHEITSLQPMVVVACFVGIPMNIIHCHLRPGVSFHEILLDIDAPSSFKALRDLARYNLFVDDELSFGRWE
jgi:hypothetical protein